MEVGDEICEKPLPLVGRTRCNTWHAEIEDQPSPPELSSLSPLGVGRVAAVKRPVRRNAWGAASYADLIAAAIESSPERRLTLAQIYDWMVTNVQYFGERADNNSSAGWKNSIRHNLSLHRRFVRVPHSDGKSSWWTISQSEPSALRWSRSQNTRRRADTLDTQSYALQRQRRSRKSAPESSADRVRKSTEKSVPLTTDTDCANSDRLDLLDYRSVFASCVDDASFLSNVINSDVNSIDSLQSRSSLSSRHLEFFGNTDHLEGIDTQDKEYESTFGLMDDFSNIMMNQLASVPWNQVDSAENINSLHDDGCGFAGTEHLPLFSEDSMLSASQLNDSSLDESLFGDNENRDIVLAAYTTVSSPSADPSFRRGSDAPPPSPESNYGDPSPTFDETVSNLAEMKVEALDENRFAVGWTPFSLKSEELSNMSDVDMEH